MLVLPGQEFKMLKYRVYVTKEGYYEVEAENKDEAFEKAYNDLPEPKFKVVSENTTDIKEIG